MVRISSPLATGTYILISNPLNSYFTILSKACSIFPLSILNTDIDEITFSNVNAFTVRRNRINSYIAKAVRDFVDPRFVIESSRLTDLVHIASGAFGKVFSGRLVDETGGNSIPIAAKRLQISTDEHLRNFLLELKVMSTVNSDSFTHFYGVCIGEPRRPLLIMELCPRGSLLDALADPKTVIGWSNALEILRDILSGLSTLHSSSPPLYHRDLKSGNCLLTAEGRVKLCDFGSARFAVRGEQI
ncbi:Protein tyrosine and serine/threonine kinase [Pelomyxa schiedti]|nr:Protein tyrosine and serine/threonine kinase [Pelomyxa schiedti]